MSDKAMLRQLRNGLALEPPGEETPAMKSRKATESLGIDEIKALHERLRDREQHLTEEGFKWLQTEFAKQRFFSDPIFDLPGASDESRESLSNPGVKYNILVLRLRNCRTNEMRLRVLA